jgi:hypothetical protein
LDDDEDDDLFLSRDEEPAEYDEYDDDGSLSCLLFVLDEILFTLLLLLELCLLSFSFSLSFDEDEVRDVLPLAVTTFEEGAPELLE